MTYYCYYLDFTTNRMDTSTQLDGTVYAVPESGGVAEGNISTQIICNLTTEICTGPEITSESPAAFEKVVAVVVPIIFGLIAVLGFCGNLLVIIVVVSNKQMRNTTNLLIINLAVADLLFIVICVPFTAAGYAMPTWPFGTVFCKIYQYMINVTAYASVYTLVLMSLDRYLAVVHAISSMTIRTERNAYVVIILSWVAIMGLNTPILFQYELLIYVFHGEERSACLNIRLIQDPQEGKIFYGCFFAFSYVIPLTLVCILYGFMLNRLLYGGVPRGNQSAESLRSKKRVTRMVVMVVLIFALCWLPIQLILMIQYFGKYPESTVFVGIQIASNCIAYMNSCVNPLLYAFLSDNFRKSFRKLLCCYNNFQPVKLEYERTNARGLEPMTRTTCTTPLNNNGHNHDNHVNHDNENGV